MGGSGSQNPVRRGGYQANCDYPPGGDYGDGKPSGYHGVSSLGGGRRDIPTLPEGQGSLL